MFLKLKFIICVNQGVFSGIGSWALICSSASNPLILQAFFFWLRVYSIH